MTDEVDAFYADFYMQSICEGNVGRAVAVAHREMERGVDERFEAVLEVGAGTGQHREYVRHAYDMYVETDLRTTERTEESVGANATLLREQADAASLHYSDGSFDRLIATCLLMHLPDPEQALAEWRRVVRVGGLLTIYVPSEPGLAVRVTRACTTARKVRKLGFAHYDLFLAREHRNHTAALDVQIRHVFKDDEIRALRWPFRIPSWNANFFTVYQIRRTGT